MSSKLRAGTPEMSSVLGSILTQVDERELPKVRESEFKEYQLKVALAVHSGIEVSLAPWINVTGDISRGISVIDDTTGEVLFSTPGIYCTAEFTVEGGFTNMIKDVADAKNLHLDPSTLFAKHLNADRAKLALGDGAQLQLTWYAIFAKYGYRMTSTQPTEGAGDTKLIEPKAEVEWGEDEFL